MLQIDKIQQLKNIGRDSSQSFYLKVLGEKLVCHKILRILPGKRIVVEGDWKGKKVVGKLFFSDHAERHIKREGGGFALLQAAKVLTPKILYQGKSSVPNLFLLLFEFVEKKHAMDEIWLGDDEKQLRELVFNMQELILQQHKNGLYHIDLHPQNFISSQNGLFLIDVSDVRRERGCKELSEKVSLNNLAIFYAQLYLKHQPLIMEAYRNYCKSRNWEYSSRLEKNLLKALKKAREIRIKKVFQRCLRNCSGIIVKKSFSTKLAYDRKSHFEVLGKLYSNPDKYIEAGAIIKKGNTCTIAKVNVDGKELVIKRYNIKNFWHLLKNCWRTSRAIKSWRNSHMLQLLGIPTPRPIAVLEKRWGIFHGRAYFICEHVPGDLLNVFYSKANKKNSGISEADQMKAAKEVVEILQSFKLVRLTHGDMKATNFILRDNCQPVLVDLDSMQIYDSARRFRKFYTKDIRRFMKNWQTLPGAKKIFHSLLGETNLGS
jgi:tRNA A-37 threonylcarbamoyl transferase component Bud32